VQYSSRFVINGVMTVFVTWREYAFLLPLHVMQTRSSDENSVSPSVCPSVRQKRSSLLTTPPCSAVSLRQLTYLYYSHSVL